MDPQEETESEFYSDDTSMQEYSPRSEEWQTNATDTDATSEAGLCEYCLQDYWTCRCPQLEAQPVKNNLDLLSFRVRSHNIEWSLYIIPLDPSVRGEAVYLDKQSDFVSAYRRASTATNRRELLVCHDMMGNYLTDRHYLSSEKYDDYRFMHWAAVDYFCYFSHEYITIPPSGWLNAAHRHGVPVLGTYIVEGAAGSRRLHEVLATKEMVLETVAALTRLCLHFLFEGWLVNVECKVRQECVPNLFYFLEQLRESTISMVPHGRVFWYDSVTETGELAWQNELNGRNVEFHRQTDGTLINYTWNDRNLDATKEIVESEQGEKRKVFMGLDVFGRGQVGGFKSVQTLARIAEYGFSAGIFAPAWCYETLQKYGYNLNVSNGDESLNAAFLGRNDRWWARVWEHLGTHPYRKLPFYTDFCVGSGRYNFRFGIIERDERPFFNLARQALQPSVPLGENAAHCFDKAYFGSCSLEVINYDRAFRLFVTEFEVPLGVLLVGYSCKLEQDHALDVVLRCSSASRTTKDMYIFCGSYDGKILTRGRSYISPLDFLLSSRVAHELLPQMDQPPRSNNWRIRYYLMRFDGPVVLRDIGLYGRRDGLTSVNACLGSIYVERLLLKDWHNVKGYQKADIQAYKKKLWNVLPGHE